MPNVYTILVTYNSTKWLSQVFDTLKKQGLLEKTIVVDNKSSDGTPDVIALNWPEVHLHRSQKNLGFGAGNNIGISMALQAGADYVFLLNHDAWPVKGSIQAAVDALSQNKKLGIVSPLHVQADELTPDALFERYLNQAGTSYARAKAAEGVTLVPFVNAAAWILPRATLMLVGGFSPLFYHYGEDSDYTERLHYHGLQLGVVSDYTIVHDRGSRAVGWKDAPKRQTFSFEVGLKQRLANPNSNVFTRLRNAATWWFGNITSALKTGYWPVLPASFKMLATAAVEHQTRSKVRKVVRSTGPHFLTP